MREKSETVVRISPSKYRLMREILEKAGIQCAIAIEPGTTFSEFLREIVGSKNMRFQDVADSAGIDRTFFSRLLSYKKNILPTKKEGRVFGDRRYAALADVLGLDRDLFLSLVREVQKGQIHEFVAGKGKEDKYNLEQICRVYRITLMKIIDPAPAKDAREQAMLEERVEETLVQFARESGNILK